MNLNSAATNSMTKVHSSEGHQAKPNRNIGIIALYLGHISSRQHIWGRQLAHLVDWLDSLWVPYHTETAYDCPKNKPLSLPDVHTTQDVCELGAAVLPFVWSLFGAAGKGPKQCR